MNDKILLQENLISIEPLTGGFEHFLSPIDNKRIFFSGRFGIGKTFFLKNFFETREKTYDLYHLFPIRYQIGSNEDIVELLKYDILLEILSKYPEAFSNDAKEKIFDWGSLFMAFCREKSSVNGFLQIATGGVEKLSALSLDPITQISSRLGRPLKNLLDVDAEFQKYKAKRTENNKDIIEKFISEVKKNADITATSYLDYLLSQKISELKEEKKSVLILDDFDRVDPEHIFRILNVLSAHFDGEDNRFGFDHIIIVGDVKNIKSIFHHRYGNNSDFWGYFDKFFTIRPYELDNKKVITEKIPSLVKQIRCEESELSGAIGESGYIKLLLADVLTRATSAEQLNLRQLYKPLNHHFIELKKGVFSKNSVGDNFQQILDIGIKLLIAIFGGDKEAFVLVLEKIKLDIKDTDREHAPYGAYISSMIRRIIKVETNVSTKWKDYSFVIPSDPRVDRFNAEGGVTAVTMLFYDVLIEYVKQSKYIKNSNWDYEE